MVSMSGKSKSTRPVSTLPATAPAPSIDPEKSWRQILSRDPEATFFYAVSTTGVFCRPSCTSRRPLRTNVCFFRSADEAQAAGFRPCKRCRPEATAWGSPLEKLKEHLEANLDRQLPLAELGRLVHLSPFTVQRLFKQSLGVSPLQYQRALRAVSLRNALKEGETVTNAIYSAGFGSSSRGYDGAQLGMTPARFVKGGRGEQIGWASAPSPFGWVIAGATARGLCWLALAGTKAEAEASLREEFPLATLKRDPALAGMMDAALRTVNCTTNSTKKLAAPQVPIAGATKLMRAKSEQLAAPQVPIAGATKLMRAKSEQLAAPQVPIAGTTKLMRAESEQLAAPQVLDLRGTAFQLRVWQALRRIPRGETRSYSQLAREMGAPHATRAVARACAMNRVALFVPCHRVIGANGSLTGYRWGVERKRRLLEAEGAKL
jgi:AraC family transcriptional regulator of adaptative response/methylated-DNA-[protein]-cysteine methyltransferase